MVALNSSDAAFLLLRLLTGLLCIVALVISLRQALSYTHARERRVRAVLGAMLMAVGTVLTFMTGYDESIAQSGRVIAGLDWAWGVADVFVPLFYLLALRAFDTRDKLERQLTAAAEIDTLTQIPNRAGFQARASLLLEGGSRSRLPLTVAMIDIDRFKHINDGWGHAAGDVVLRRLAQIVRAALRDGDVFARFGGEEFILLVNGMTPDEAFPLVERLRTAIAEDVPHPSGEDGRRVTVSAGLALVEAYHPAALKAAIERADEALYAAKNAGRDRSMIAAAA